MSNERKLDKGYKNRHVKKSFSESHIFDPRISRDPTIAHEKFFARRHNFLRAFIWEKENMM